MISRNACFWINCLVSSNDSFRQIIELLKFLNLKQGHMGGRTIPFLNRIYPSSHIHGSGSRALQDEFSLHGVHLPLPMIVGKRAIQHHKMYVCSEWYQWRVLGGSPYMLQQKVIFKTLWLSIIMSWRKLRVHYVEFVWMSSRCQVAPHKLQSPF